jgi:hypothetical protein
MPALEFNLDLNIDTPGEVPRLEFGLLNVKKLSGRPCLLTNLADGERELFVRVA